MSESRIEQSTAKLDTESKEGKKDKVPLLGVKADKGEGTDKLVSPRKDSPRSGSPRIRNIIESETHIEGAIQGGYLERSIERKDSGTQRRDSKGKMRLFVDKPGDAASRILSPRAAQPDAETKPSQPDAKKL
jgi:hypothetical protein